jgi:hypothetical protein
VGARFDSSYSGIGELLNSELILSVMEQIAGRARDRAVALAPVGGEGDPHPGRYKGGFRVEAHRHGGAKRDRAEAILRNGTPEAFYVEFGTSKQEAHHIVLRSMYEAAGNL